MTNKLKILLPIFALLLLLLLAAIWFFGNNNGHIADTNGNDDHSLHTITDDNIRLMNLEALNVDVHTDPIVNTKTYRSDCFTGVYEVFSQEVADDRFEIVINHAKVEAGNFKMVLCVDGEIVHTFTNNQLSQSYLLENVTGTVSLRIAGESADFMFDYYIYTFHLHGFSVN